MTTGIKKESAIVIVPSIPHIKRTARTIRNSFVSSLVPQRRKVRSPSRFMCGSSPVSIDISVGTSRTHPAPNRSTRTAETATVSI